MYKLGGVIWNDDGTMACTDKTVTTEPIKLVRDKIPQIMENSGIKSFWHIASEDEYLDFLFKKLQEEVNELIAAKDDRKHALEECADVYEVLAAIIGLYDFSEGGWEEWYQIFKDKREERGKFDKRIILDKEKI